MGRMVICPFDGVSISADATQDLWSLMAAATNKLILHGWEITSADISAEIIACSLKRISAVGSVGSAGTEVKLDDDDGAITGSVRYGDTTPGTATGILQGFQWEQVGPLGQIYTPEMRPVIEVSTGVALVCSTAVAFTMSGWVCWEEI